MDKIHANKRESGYITLISAIIIAGVLMVATFSLSYDGFTARFNLLDRNNKEKSLQLAEGCANIAVQRLLEDVNYFGNETISIGSEECSILDIDPIDDTRTIRTSSVVGSAYTNIEVGVIISPSQSSTEPESGPTPSPIPSLCADTIMMLDRTGSMNATARADEQVAAKNLINLFSGVFPTAKIGVGRFGDSANGGIEAEILTSGQLTDVYGDDDPGNDSDNDLFHAVETATNTNSSVGTNLKDAIDVAQAELESSRGTSLPNVIIIISDGDPSEPTTDPLTAASNAANSAKAAGTEIFTIHFGDDPSGLAGQELLLSMATDENHFFVSPTSADLQDLFVTIANNICPEISNPILSPASSYIDINSWKEVPNF
ncbi:MAG: hypothetical protein A3B86_02945 [Candidatus Yanofskybacteria bacterium RIFCSPHIGHO2_02_FULL_38_22b]|uniref:VWFA domain-containing protein n=1 Tax=Candidatus Yanofskybacteria bacterium RIFCSPHIGHO2_02_FULL_38_22b TaxID=1802673 RepID=A0A1F8F3I6_9BACT|nr:MAG: hypothetical protein A2816_02535 [Candidatus Yanofskybacteria bacterium RIFCSPHIGHO2_01_FULL_39_44]OGN06829.1 MAG: hypothetical protein A3B86_02945 [Candidatus Yanofskybacteria bacterium RIFCSPHIGHO2_02_FULL_38_22b]OGN20724.1 MAG: hypothetical protein A2910_00905 [Candidatus Yanofskybacteria bacterium RIFCSPLOWO2_01_FULL_39_28]